MKKGLGLIIVGVVITVLLTGCMSVKPLEQANQPSTSLLHDVTIGVVVPLSGANAKLGQSTLRGIALAANESNNSIKLIIEDDGCDAKRGLSATKKLVEMNNVAAIIGPLCTVAIVPSITYVEEQQVPRLTAGMVLQVTANAGPNHFSLLPEFKHQMNAIALYASKQNYHRISLIAVNDDLGRETAKELRFALGLHNIELVGEDYFEKTQTDYATMLRKSQANDVDAIFLMGYAGQLASIVRDAEETQVKPALLSWNLYQDTTVLGLGAAAERVVYSYPEDPRNLSVKMHFAKLYKETYGEDPDVYASNAYDSYNVLYDALTQCSNNRTCIRQTIGALQSYEGANGYITLDDRGVGQRAEVSLKTVKNGAFVTLH